MCMLASIILTSVIRSYDYTHEAFILKRMHTWTCWCCRIQGLKDHYSLSSNGVQPHLLQIPLAFATKALHRDFATIIMKETQGILKRLVSQTATVLFGLVYIRYTDCSLFDS